MRFSNPLLTSILLVGAGIASASSWGFEEAFVSVSSKNGGGIKDKITTKSPLGNIVTLGATDTLKILLTTTENGKPKRPHQAFLLLQDQDTGVEDTIPFSVKDSGKAKVDLTQKDLPIQLLTSTQPLQATLLIASFGASDALSSHVFNLEVKLDPAASAPTYEKPLRYGKLAEISHIFKADPRSGPIVISLFFVAAVLATVPILLGAWAYLGANLSHLGMATSIAPISHTLFFGSIVSLEGIFFLYYYSWNLFQTLPAAGVVGLVAFLSGSKALSEVQSRRLAGERS
ncbi:Oligosaccharyltransferase subunit Ribophorin II-domain-containing protein [Calycina marina]|uniref:Oligosaccharyltransferase subunit Ribophorin II-domain-containing protein n=1 Tax=Calycina marina TaxID=1763456 RepID=A0A9P7Z4F5_9HELO|nr:Oligosaccharyltransferase subunit Ribophorin II-domain-containing protein [Calycina marina]